MRRTLSLILFLLITVLSAHAVLKEKDLARTLAVLKEELKADYGKQQQFREKYELQSKAQHQQLVSYMQKCEQASLILYSQNSEYTFDMAYACQQATDLYRNVSSNSLPFDLMRQWAEHEILRYDELIRSLKRLPPIAKDDANEVLTAADSVVWQAIDSLANIRDVLGDSVQNAVSPMTPTIVEENELLNEPYSLTPEQRQDRAECLLYADSIKANLVLFLENLNNESSYYTAVGEKAKQLNDFAQAQYAILRNSIFRNGASNYFSLLAHLPTYVSLASSTIHNKYMPFEEQANDFSEWRGSHMLFISVFLIIYIFIATLISTLIVRFFVPKRFKSELFRRKQSMINASLGIFIFALAVMAARNYTDRNFILMSTSLMILIAWLLLVVFLSLLIRLDDKQTRSALHVYMPFILVAFIVILFRIVLIPNVVVSLAFPPIMLVCTAWQIWAVYHNKQGLPKSDMFYCNICSLAMLVAMVASWLGYTLMAVQIMVWWMFQLAAIQTITCIYDLLRLYQKNVIALHINPAMKERKQRGEDIQDELIRHLECMANGEYITKTWLFDFVCMCALPIVAVWSVLQSIWWAASIFEMSSLFRDAFLYKFIDQPDLIQLSMAQICVVAALWFVFRYIVYLLRNCYRHYRQQFVGEGDRANLTLANNVISILFWGIYFIIALVVLRIPKSGISVVTAGLATGLGFAMKDLLENFFYGISLMTGRVRVGDYIECDGIQGKVESITYQSTQLLTPDGCVIAFLNSALFSKNFKNLTRNHRYELVKLPIGVAYGTNVEAVRQMLIEAITPVCQEQNAAGECVTEAGQPVKVEFVDFGASSIDLAVCIWMLVEEKRALSGRVKEVIYNTLNANDVEIPFPQCDVHMR